MSIAPLFDASRKNQSRAGKKRRGQLKFRKRGNGAGSSGSGQGRADVTVRKRPQPGRETIISNREVPLGTTKGARD
jgi:hypothetical protein